MSRDRNLITGTFPVTQCRGALGRPCGIAIAGLDQGGPLPPYYALGRSYIPASWHTAARPQPHH